MARPLRIEFPGAIYHVTARGNERRGIVRDDVDRWKWRSLLERTVARHGWRVFAFALMGNHFHLFLQTPQANLSAGVHHLSGSYAGYFNARHRRRGHLLEGRFRSILVEDTGYWRQLSRYVHLNPVRAGLAQRPEDWGWSSYAGYHRPARRVPWIDYSRVLAEFGGDTSSGRQAYRQFVAEGLGRALDSPLAKAAHGLVLGSDAFVAKVRAMAAAAAKRAGDPELPALADLTRPAGLDAVIAAATKALGGDVTRWQPRRRCDDLSRPAAAFLARRATRASDAEIAQRLGYRSLSSVSVACRRVEAALADNPKLAHTLARLAADLTTNH